MLLTLLQDIEYLVQPAVQHARAAQELESLLLSLPLQTLSRLLSSGSLLPLGIQEILQLHIRSICLAFGGTCRYNT